MVLSGTRRAITSERYEGANVVAVDVSIDRSSFANASRRARRATR